MGNKRLDMHRLQEVIRLYRLGQSRRAIAKQLRLGRNTISAYMAALATANVLEGPPGELPGLEELRAIVGEHVAVKSTGALPQHSSSVERWREVVVRLRAKGAGPKGIFDYLRLHDDVFDGSLSAIKRLCCRIDREQGPRATDVAIPVETAPGEVAQVDFVYAKKRYDPERGVLRKSWLFVMTLGFSRRMYCALVFDQRVETWLRLHIDAFEYFGGVPSVIVPDNLKAAVIRAAFAVDNDPVINRSYRELARHYGFQVDPTPPRSPEKKGKVERSGRYVKSSFLTTWETVDIKEDQRQLVRWNKEIADQRTHGTMGAKPIDLFEEAEAQALIVLPATRWELVVWKQATLHTDSHVQIDGAFYSAPWRFLHQSLWARCTPHVVALYRQDELLYTHLRAPRGKRSTVEVHLPEYRRDLRHRSREHWIARARAVGAEVETLVTDIFGSDDVLLKLRKVQAVVTHLESHPKKRACATARRALHFGCMDYRSIKNILRQGLDMEPLPSEADRAWSQDSRYARKPTEPVLARKDLLHVDHE